MINWIKEIDQQILLAINGMNTPFLDTFMWLVSDKFVWFPFYLFLFFLVYRKYSLKHAVLFTLFGIAAIGFADSIATYGFKYNFARYRPSYHEILGEKLHFYQIRPGDFYKGGKYGFISSHAANSCVIAVFFIRQLKNYYKWVLPVLTIWVLLIVYSRMYLGVHYPTDIIGGIIWGVSVGLFFHWIYRKLINSI